MPISRLIIKLLLLLLVLSIAGCKFSGDVCTDDEECVDGELVTRAIML